MTQAITADTTVSQLQWSFDGGLGKSKKVCKRIAEHCGLDVLMCAHSNGCELTEKACFKAAARGNIEMVEWGIGKNYGWRW
ncbi:unnamed protein product, partial [Laminaria digitata]